MSNYSLGHFALFIAFSLSGQSVFAESWKKETYIFSDNKEITVSYKKLFGRTIMTTKSEFPDIIDLREFDCESKKYRHFAAFHKDNSKWILHTPDSKNHQVSANFLPDFWTWTEITKESTILNDLLKEACK